MYVKRNRRENDNEASSPEEDSETEEPLKPAVYVPGTEEPEFYSNFVVAADKEGEMIPGNPLPQWVELSDGTTMRKRTFPQVKHVKRSKLLFIVCVSTGRKIPQGQD